MHIQKLSLLCAVLLPWSVLAQEQLNSESADALATRGAATVTQLEFDARMSLIPVADRAPFLRDAGRLEKVVAEMLLQKQLAADARRSGFEHNDLVRTRMELAATAELARAWLEHYISQQGDADYESLAREQYQLQPERFKSRPSIDVSHILISTAERAVDEAEQIARDVRAQLAEDPDAWDALVMEFSEDPSVATNRGKFSGVKAGDMVKRFETVAFALETGQISDPVRTQYGFHLIRLDARHEPRQLDFDTVKTQLMEQQRDQHRERVRVDYIEQLSTLETQMSEADLRKALGRYFNESELAGQAQTDSE
jgi:peptidyl-prolyl cis-trans isomerase C